MHFCSQCQNMYYISINPDDSNKLVYYWHYLVVFILNYVMLYFGYLGENEKMDKIIALFFGFIAFIIG